MTYLDSKFIKRLASSLNNFDFLFVGNHAYTFAKELEKCNNIKVMGPVSHDKILSTQNSAAYLLAFDTASSSMIPGKIFEYFSAKKPVIFCSMNQQCSYINYLDKYENYIFIRTDYDEEKIVEVFLHSFNQMVMTPMKPSLKTRHILLLLFLKNTLFSNNPFYYFF